MKSREEIRAAILRQMLKEAGLRPDLPPECYAENYGYSLGVIKRLAGDIVASGARFLLVHNGAAIMCLKCAAVSHNPHDVEQRYCGNCRAFLDDEAAAQEA